MSSLYIWPQMPALSAMVLIGLSMVFLYFARAPLHLVLESLNDGIAGGMTKTAEWIKAVVIKLREKNRRVLLESGIANCEQKLAQEFRRLELSYTKHLADYPSLHLKLDESIASIDADFKECGQVVPEAPGWSDVVESIAKVKGESGDRIIEKMLKELHKTAIDGEKKALSEMRKTAASRHKILSSIAPTWNKVHKLMDVVNNKVTRVIETTGKIEKYISEYDRVKCGGVESIDMLSSKTTKLFIISMLVILVAGFGAFINFNLIALPMSELVPAGSRVLGLQVSDVSALVIVTLEVVLGIFLMEALGITGIFPQVTGMTLSKRRILLYASLLGLFFLASVETALAVLREHIAETNAATAQALAGKVVTAVGGESSKIPVIGQATLGFVLPWILAMVAVPLEVMIESSQYVVSRLMILVVMLFGYFVAVVGHVINMIMKAIMHIFDAYIIIPSQIGNLIKSKS